MKEKIIKAVRKIEKEEGVKVLFLIESGSRAWGWESEDSDYDIRGVYVQDYLVINEIDSQLNKVVGDLDIELWDLKKFLSLMLKSNPSTWEWLSSDMIYIDNPLREELKYLFEKNFSKQALKKHYVSMAKDNFYKYINRIADKANLKKYTYVLRSIACFLWIEKNKSAPPKNYKGVIKLLPKDIQSFFNKVINDKKKSESLEGNRNKDVERYIISFFDKEFEKDESSFDIDELNSIFKKCAQLN